MKSNFLILFSCFLGFNAMAQFPYEVSEFTQPYEPLSDATLLELEPGWDDPEMGIAIPFLGHLGSTEFNQLFIAGTGEMLAAIDEDDTFSVLWPISIDVMDVAAAVDIDPEDFSTIGTQLYGEEPNRIFKIEWNNVGVYEEVAELGTAEQRANFQVWLYENDDIIEYHFGESNIDATIIESALTSGIILNFDQMSYEGTLFFASGNSDNPQWDLNTNFEAWFYGGETLSAMPSADMVYRFAPVSTDIEIATPSIARSWSAFPNPSPGPLIVQNYSDEVLRITGHDITGKTVDAVSIAPYGSAELHLVDCPTGLYIVMDDAGNTQKILRE